MAGPVKRSTGLTVLFWRYLLTVGVCIGTASLIWWAVLGILLQMGAVLPAAYAASHVQEAAETLQKDFLPEDLPHYYRWAVFDKTGGTADAGNMDSLCLEYARQSLSQGGTSARHFPYTQYHWIVPLQGGDVCILQYDYSIPYTDPALQACLPDFQLSWLVLLAALWALLAGLCTHHYARLFRQDAQTIASATRAVTERRLDEPFTGETNVRELGEALEGMDVLRQNLAESLERQWAMEQQRQRELAGLTHDLKTPLTIIRGNGELLAEETLLETQRESVDAILRGAERLENYVERLRALSAGDGWEESFTSVPLAELYQIWQKAGAGLCGPQDVHFTAQAPPELMLYVRREAISRAALNLLDNAARYAGKGGEVTLSARTEGALLLVTVTDTGPGFSTPARSCPQDGHMGWGLRYARQVMRDHGGELVLLNTDCGALAELRWPYQAVNPADKAYREF